MGSNLAGSQFLTDAPSTRRCQSDQIRGSLALGKQRWLAKRLGKPLIIGELGLHAIAKTDKKVWYETPAYFESYDDTKAAKPWVAKILNDVIEASVPLSHWWCYQSDNPSEHTNRQRFDIDRGRNPELVACVVEANKRLKAKLLPRP